MFRILQNGALSRRDWENKLSPSHFVPRPNRRIHDKLLAMERENASCSHPKTTLTWYASHVPSGLVADQQVVPGKCCSDQQTDRRLILITGGATTYVSIAVPIAIVATIRLIGAPDKRTGSRTNRTPN